VGHPSYNLRQDPGVKVRRRISFKATNLIGSFQDDVKNLTSPPRNPEVSGRRALSYRILFPDAAKDVADAGAEAYYAEE
jgi:hypothetical protein